MNSDSPDEQMTFGFDDYIAKHLQRLNNVVVMGDQTAAPPPPPPSQRPRHGRMPVGFKVEV